MRLIISFQHYWINKRKEMEIMWENMKILINVSMSNNFNLTTRLLNNWVWSFWVYKNINCTQNEQTKLKMHHINTFFSQFSPSVEEKWKLKEKNIPMEKKVFLINKRTKKETKRCMNEIEEKFTKKEFFSAFCHRRLLMFLYTNTSIFSSWNRCRLLYYFYDFP